MRPAIRIALLFYCAIGALSLFGANSDGKPGDAKRGLVVFNQCAVCHDNHAENVPNPGPDLHGVVGRRAGSLPGYRYSRAMRNARRVWTEAALDAYIADPQAAVPGNTMPFPGIANAVQRRDLIAYLKTLK